MLCTVFEWQHIWFVLWRCFFNRWSTFLWVLIVLCLSTCSFILRVKQTSEAQRNEASLSSNFTFSYKYDTSFHVNLPPNSWMFIYIHIISYLHPHPSMLIYIHVISCLFKPTSSHVYSKLPFQVYFHPHKYFTTVSWVNEATGGNCRVTDDA